MTNEPIINARFKKFCENYELQGIPEDEAFEQFVNIAILTHINLMHLMLTLN